jgi:hypothetical protein
MIFKRKIKTEYVGLGEVKDWKDAGPEIERIGQRLDAVRGMLKDIPKRGKRHQWARNHWSQIEANLLTKWRMMIMFKDTGLRQIGQRPGPEIDYDWWEPSDEIRSPIPWPAFMENWGNRSDLEQSWANAQERKLQKARQGLA